MLLYLFIGETDTSCCCVNDTAPAQDSKLIQQNLVCSVASDSDTALQVISNLFHCIPIMVDIVDPGGGGGAQQARGPPPL